MVGEVWGGSFSEKDREVVLVPTIILIIFFEYIYIYWKDNKCRDCFHLILEHTSTADSSGDDLKRSADSISKDGAHSKQSKRDRIVKEVSSQGVYTRAHTLAVRMYSLTCMRTA